MKFRIADLLKWSKVFALLAIANYSYGQETKLTIELPLLSYDISSLSSLDRGFNGYYSNDYFIPNLRVGLMRNGLYVGFETYYTLILNYNDLNLASILRLKVESYSLLAGLERDFDRISARFTLGVTYNDAPIGAYVDNIIIHTWEPRTCYGFNAFSPLVSTNIKYAFYRNFSVGLNLRLNPMLKPYQRISNSCPNDFLDHDRVHYMVAQLTIRYDIDLKRKNSGK